MAGGRGRSSRRRGGPTRRPNLRRVFKRMQKRARPVGRSNAVGGGGTSSTTVKAIRRFDFFPRLFTDAGSGFGSANDTWWLQLLKSIGKIVMQIVLETLLTTPVGLDLGLSSDVKVATASIMRIAIGAEDLLAQTPHVVTTFSNNIPVSKMRYRQARVDWIKVKVIPHSKVPDRAGLLYLSLDPCTRDQVLDDFGSVANEKLTIDELQQHPNVTIDSAVRERHARWSPREGDFGYNWQMVGETTSTTFPFAGGLPVCYLTLAYVDESANEAGEVVGNYKLHEALFSVFVTGMVHLRQGEENVTVRSKPLEFVKSAKLKHVQGSSVELLEPSEYKMVKGFFVKKSSEELRLEDLAIDSVESNA